MASEDRGPAGADRDTDLERRGRLLLRAYPAAYRRERGEEMIGTLLETTPNGRAWPRLRDVRALAMGGLRARAAQNRGLSAAANLRVAVMAGISMYMVVMAAQFTGIVVIDPGPLADEWPDVVVGLLVATTVLAVWIAPRVVAAVSCLAAAVAGYFVGRQVLPFWPLISLLACVAAIVLLAPRSVRPPRAWLWLIGAFAGAVVASDYGSAGLLLQVAPVLALVVVSAAWVAIDARLAVAVATFLLTFYVQRTELFFNAGMLPVVLALVAVAAPAIWLLRRQSAPRARSS